MDPTDPESQQAASAVVPSRPHVKSPQLIIEEFQYLQEKSQQLFAGLRDLPPHGSPRLWQPYFQRTFECFTKLWKFQQQNRLQLEQAEGYALKRWEVGEIASKIGQLYYHYYLRTSETNYLWESFVFYEAIRERQYFRDVMKAKNPALMIKKLRYFARYIVVCLLLNKTALVRTLVTELKALVDDYAKAYKNTDASEWQLVIQEISGFMEIEKHSIPVDLNGSPHPVSYRLIVDEKSSQSSSQVNLNKSIEPIRLQEVMIVGNHSRQVKFSELTLDMFRFLQLVEHEPVEELMLAAKKNIQQQQVAIIPANVGSSTSGGGGGTEKQKMDEKQTSSKRVNPHKYLLFRPSFSQLMVYLSTAFKDLEENACLLLYMSAEPHVGFTDTSFWSAKDAVEGYLHGGVVTNPKAADGTPAGPAQQTAPFNCLYPADIAPFIRKPLFVIVDSPNSDAFNHFIGIFEQPLVCIMSPKLRPPATKDPAKCGNLLTLFLNSPILGFSHVSDVWDFTPERWKATQESIESTENFIYEQLYNSTTVDLSYKRFMEDLFLRRLIVRYLFCYIVLLYHKNYKETRYLPDCRPSMPVEILQNSELMRRVQELVEMAGAHVLYHFNEFL